ncbi:MAG: membrane protein of unknown function [Promethearchaeota archaeon]|nr:MAG: membrane protein of unknown function [Candidatus Lokiarchaeota archaeon]
MSVQKREMRIYGILRAVIYLIIPISAIFILDLLNLMSFSLGFIIGILIFGVIGVIMTVLKHMYPTGTAKNSALHFLASIYKAIYIFYVFGGFTSGVELGYYQIETQFIIVILGLKLLAWLLLSFYLINSLKYLLEAIELRGTRKGSVVHQKRTKVSIVFKVFSILAMVALAIYLGTLIWSGTQIMPNISDFPLTSYDNNGTPSDYSDDDYNITFAFSLSNNGIYALRDVFIYLEVWTTDKSTDPLALPPYQKIGESFPYYSSSFSSLVDKSQGFIMLFIYPPYLPGLVENYALLEYRVILRTYFGGIYINAAFSVESPWLPLNITAL